MFWVLSCLLFKKLRSGLFFLSRVKLPKIITFFGLTNDIDGYVHRVFAEFVLDSELIDTAIIPGRLVYGQDTVSVCCADLNALVWLQCLVRLGPDCIGCWATREHDAGMDGVAAAELETIEVAVRDVTDLGWC